MVKIITDSTCDIPSAELKQMGVEMIPLTVRFGEKIYRDGIDLSHDQFYEMLSKASELPRTSQINPDEFEEKYRELLGEDDEIVSIHIASKLSGTFQSANIAKNEVDAKRIFCVDSKSASFGMAIIVKHAVKMRDLGATASEIEKECSSIADRLRIVALVVTLKYLQKGGRLSKTSAFVGEALGIKPVALVSDGEVEVIGKARGERSGMEIMKKFISEHRIDYRYPIAFGHSNALENLYEKMEHFKANFPKMQTSVSFISDLGPVVGTHVGPGIFAIGYVEEI